MAPFQNSVSISCNKLCRGQRQNPKVHLIAILSLLFCIISLYGVNSGRIETRALEHLSTISFRCKFAKYEAVDNSKKCNLGSYWDSCGRQVCFKDINEDCDDNSNLEVHGNCGSTLRCFCGKCMGCTENRCGMDLVCKHLQQSSNQRQHQQRHDSNLIQKFDELFNTDFLLN